MKSKKAHPYYYKLMRISKTAQLLSTMTLIVSKSDYVKNLKPLINELETAILCNKAAASFYKTKSLLNE